MKKPQKKQILPSIHNHIDRPFADKLKQTREIILHHNEPDHFPINQQAIGWSGGKDSTLVLFLVREVTPDIAVVFCNTGVEYPQTVKFVRDTAKEYEINLIEITKKDLSFWDCVNKWGYPKGKSKRKDGKRQTDHCCYYLKEKPMFQAVKEYGWKCVYDGITAVESRNRQIRASIDGVCFHHKQWNCCKVHPILWWTEEEVWNFTRSEGIPYNPIYDLGESRCGCMPCTAFSTWKESLQNTNPRMYRKIMADMGQELIT